MVDCVLLCSAVRSLFDRRSARGLHCLFKKVDYRFDLMNLCKTKQWHFATTHKVDSLAYEHSVRLPNRHSLPAFSSSRCFADPVASPCNVAATEFSISESVLVAKAGRTKPSAEKPIVLRYTVEYAFALATWYALTPTEITLAEMPGTALKAAGVPTAIAPRKSTTGEVGRWLRSMQLALFL